MFLVDKSTASRAESDVHFLSTSSVGSLALPTHSLGYLSSAASTLHRASSLIEELHSPLTSTSSKFALRIPMTELILSHWRIPFCDQVRISYYISPCAFHFGITQRQGSMSIRHIISAQHWSLAVK